jgi:16S rRNA processing protein RimM
VPAFDRLVQLGVVRGAYGVRGWVRIAPHAADVAVLLEVDRWWLCENGKDSTPRLLSVQDRRRHATALLAKWTGCDNKEAADALKGATIAVARKDFPQLPPDEYYWADLFGSRVVNRAGEELGIVSGRRATARAELTREWLEVSDGAKTLLIPLVAAYVDQVDVAARVIHVDWERDW